MWILLSRADHRIKIIEKEEIDKYLIFARELKKLWNMRVTTIPIVVGALGMVPKGLERGTKRTGRFETIQTTTLLRSARIQKTVPGDIRFPVTQTPVKNHHLTRMWKIRKENNNNIIIIIIIIFFIIVSLHTVMWYQVFVSIKNNFQTDCLTHWWELNRSFRSGSKGTLG